MVYFEVKDSRNKERMLEVKASRVNGAARLDLKLDRGRTAHFILGEKEVKRVAREIAEAI